MGKSRSESRSSKLNFIRIVECSVPVFGGRRRSSVGGRAGADGTGGYVAPEEWMDKDEVSFEATSTALSPIFRIPDEIIVRVRKHRMDDGYEGARVDIRSRGHTHLPNDRGTNVARVRQFLNAESW